MQVLPSGASCSPGDGHWHRTSPFSTSQPYWQLAMPQVRASDGHKGNTTHINQGEKSVYCSHSHFLSFSHPQFIFSLQPLRKSHTPFLILAELTLRRTQQNSTHSAIIRFLLLCAHNLAHAPTFILSYNRRLIIHLHPIEAPAWRTSVVERCQADQDPRK